MMRWCSAFFNKTWAGVALAGAGIWAFYTYAPSPDEETYFGRLVEYWMTPASEWARLNNKHLIQSVEKQAEVLFVQDAKKPNIIRYRFPQ